MRYESISAIVVLTVLIAIIVLWLPKRTIDSMKQVAEHHQDKYSSSMHFVDVEKGIHYSDGNIIITRGELMNHATETLQKLTPQRIAEIRSLRRQAAQRRAALLLAFTLITVIVFISSFFAHFSPFFAIIPLIVVGALLFLGIRVNQKALAWEKKLMTVQKMAHKGSHAKSPMSQSSVKKDSAKKNNAESQKSTVSAKNGDAVNQLNSQKKSAADSSQSSQGVISQDETPTVLMKQGDVKKVLTNTTDNAHKNTQLKGQEVQHSVKQATVKQETSGTAIVPAAPALSQKNVAQDLISFSLGAQQSREDEIDSLEIKSQKQVAKAIPHTRAKTVEDLSPRHNTTNATKQEAHNSLK